jgi:hypothetical protein
MPDRIAHSTCQPPISDQHDPKFPDIRLACDVALWNKAPRVSSRQVYELRIPYRLLIAARPQVSSWKVLRRGRGGRSRGPRRAGDPTRPLSRPLCGSAQATGEIDAARLRGRLSARLRFITSSQANTHTHRTAPIAAGQGQDLFGGFRHPVGGGKWVCMCLLVRAGAGVRACGK